MDKEQVKILLVDDEADILEFLGYNLIREGYIVEKAKNGKLAIRIAREFKPHIVILDVMMPEMDGMETCTVMRAMPELQNPLIVFLTARGEDYSQVAGFEAGADDYLTKPIKPKIFLSRIQALLRRLHKPVAETLEDDNDLLETAGIKIDRNKYVVIRGEEEVSLPKKEFELLFFLARSPNKVVTRDEIFSAVWGDDVVVGDRTIDVHIRRIRERLFLDNIRTIKGVGYKFEVK
ncbi:MAG: response regulator transcription factor [Bacteroidales bacterium]|nr:response regulator transcription factor [Bacteroidales bacterium]